MNEAAILAAAVIPDRPAGERPLQHRKPRHRAASYNRGTTPDAMPSLITSLYRALVAQLHPRMLLLTLLPFVVALVLWGIALWTGLQPLIDQLHAWFADYGLFRTAGEMLDAMGLSSVRAIVVPLLAMWLLLPFMIVTALVLVGSMAMPAIARHVGLRQYPQLELRRGGSFAGSLWVSLSSFFVFIVIWLLTLPLNLIPLFALFVQPVLWGWLACRVMSYDALADYADADERRRIMLHERWPLLVIGIASGSLGAAPGLLWLGGVMSVIFFPILAAVAIWLYLLIFVFSGLWFQYYCLEALARLRSTPPAATPPEAERTIDIP